MIYNTVCGSLQIVRLYKFVITLNVTLTCSRRPTSLGASAKRGRSGYENNIDQVLNQEPDKIDIYTFLFPIRTCLARHIPANIDLDAV